MKKTFTPTCTAATMPTYLWSNKSAPSDSISRRLLFFCLSLLIVAGSYTDIKAQCPGSNGGTGCTFASGSTTAQPTCSGTYQVCATMGPGMTCTLALTASTYYDFEETTTGSYTTANAIDFNSVCNTAPPTCWNSGSTTTLTIGSYRSSAIGCGSWSGIISSVLQYRYSTPGSPSWSSDPSTACINVAQTYTVNAPSCATEYIWTVTGVTATYSGTTAGTSQSIIFTQAGTATVTVYASNNGQTNSGSISQTVTVYAASVAGTITQSPANGGNVCNGSNVTYTYSGGTGSFNYFQYQWNTTSGAYSGDWNPGNGYGANPGIWPSSLNAPSILYVIGTVTNGVCPSVNTSPVSINVNTAGTAPTGVTGTGTTCTGGSITLTESGGSLGTSGNYQWGTGGTVGTSPIGGATGATYTPSPGSTTTYWVSVTSTSACGSPGGGATGTVTVAAQPSLTSPLPATQTDCNGATPTNITTTPSGGTGTITYQWYSSVTNTNSGGAPVGTSSTTYTPPTTTNGTAYYYCTMAATGSGCAMATSPLNDAQVIIDAQPTISTQPTVSQSACTGATITLNAAATGGTGSWTYQWYYNASNSNSGGTPIASATSSSYTLVTSNSSLASPAGTGFAGGPFYYYCVITPTGYTNGCSAVASNTAAVTIVAQPSLTTPAPSTQTDCNGATPTNISTTVSTSGLGTTSYQWYSSGTNVNSGGTNLGSGSGGNTLTYTPSTAANGTKYYYCVISATGNGCNSVPSPLNDAIVIVDAQPVINTQGASTNTPCQGVASTLSASATNSVSGGTFSYQWYYNGTTNSNTGGSAITGASGSGLASNANTTYTLSTTNVTTASPGGTGVVGGPFYYYCVFTPSSGTGCNSTTTSPIAITVEPNQIITLTSAAGSDNQAEFCEGTPLPINIVYTLSGGATGIASVSGLPAGITGSLSGLTYTISGTPTANGTFNYFVITNGTCSGTVATGTITVSPTNQAIQGSPTSANVCAATSSTYTVPSGYSSTGGGSVLWTSSSTSGTPGSITAGATGYTPTYSFSSDEIANGATVTLTMTVSNAYCSNATTTFTINAFGATSATAGSTTSAIVCAATSSTYTVPAGYSSTNGAVLWTRSSTSGSPGSITAGSTGYTPTYTFSANEIANGATITLTMTVSNAGCASSTATFIINAYGAPTATASGVTSANVCASTSSTYTVPGSDYNSTNGTVLWTSSSTSGTPGSITAGSTGYTPTYTFSSDEIANGATITLTMTVSNASSCSPATKTFTINAFPATTATAGSTSTASVCSYTSSYTVPSGYSSGPGSTVSWSASSTSGSNGTISGGTGYTPTYTFSSADKNSATTVTVTLTMTASNGGCTSSTATFTLTISPTPQLSNQTYTVCGSVSFTYTPSGGVIPSGTSYSWSAPTGTGFTDSTGAGSGSAIKDNLTSTTTSPATATYSVTPTAGSCTGTPFNVAVTVNPAPSAASIASVMDPCVGGYASDIIITGGAVPYTFQLTPPSAYYTIYGADTVMSGQGASSVTLSNITDANGCSAGIITGSPISFGSRALTTGDSADCIVTSGHTMNFYDHSAQLMASVSSSSALGNTGVTVSVDGSVQEFGPTHEQHYLQRHFVITPANNVAANVCLYMLDGEVNNLYTASMSDNTAQPDYGVFPQSTASNSAFQAGVSVMKYDGGAETPSSHSSELVISGITAYHNPTIDGYTYSGVWQICYNVGSFSGFYVYASNTDGDPLPVTLVSFTANAVNNQYIELNWTTASEVNNSGFEIERSIDGTTYQSIAWVDGHGNSEVTNEYQYSDLTAIPGVVYYYRLKQVDFDGNYTFSQIASAQLTGDKGFTLQGLYPNPATNQVTVGVISNLATSATMTMTDVLGRSIMQQDWALSVGYNTNVYDLSNISAGTYLVTISSGAVKTTKQLIITK